MPIYRYKFTEEFMADLFQFSKIHQYDHRHDFKKAWTEWTEVNENKVTQEIRRLNSLGYEGDILDKMFKSARYYFRKKSTVKPEPKQRRGYVSVNKSLLDAMDRHIRDGEGGKPADTFVDFCENNKDELREEVINLVEFKFEKDEIINKIKKTYKNRYFMIVKK